ncbi:tetratricopeptide repeat protein [Aquimarina spongiae]|uniref:Tetratricopeptide repeat-containing protein n=1 Tax=Aquimarina spongiae TaxID=570521 RepID=A0A1M6JK91_9FLAO|nr:tetratricopeptide repeat protein [Aquimarina spongiae]SHJ47079.1 hypothetical protein SAMN04488508_109110 [Aquimarina spongiae]
MERNQELFEKIEGYLNKTLSQEELTAFEKEVMASTALQEEVEKHRVLHETLSDTDTLAFREKLIRISQEIKAEEQATSSGSSHYWKIAASIAVIIGVSALLWFSGFGKDQNEDLYATYYEPFPVEDTTRGEDTQGFVDVLTEYSKGEYQQILPKLEEIVNAKQTDSLGNRSSTNQFNLYLGNSYMNTNQEKKAILVFESIAKSSKYYENAQWYLGLTYLKLGKPTKTKSILEGLIQYNGVYKDKSVKLLEELP